MSPVVSTVSGSVEGYQQDGLSVFKGIPYATPPVGENRWLKPQRISWPGVRETKRYGNDAPQNVSAMDGMLGAAPEPPEQGEDCLYLNIWTPATDDAARPVMVWIHGGGFTIGAGSQLLYDGALLASKGDVVIVTINYRLGALGFMNLNEITGGAIAATGNEGLLDQTAALEWVRENIAVFGGDPGNVTIFGESAGGMSVGSLLALPEAKGLFHKAIPQSGACHTAITKQESVRVAQAFLDILKIEPADTAALMNVSVEDLLAAQAKLALEAGKLNLPGMSFQPVIDGEVLPCKPIQAIADGFAKGVPVLAGSILEEWKLFSALNPALKNLSEEKLRESVAELSPQHVDEIISIYTKHLQDLGKSAQPADIQTAITTDRVFRMPAIQLLEKQKPHEEKTYSYIFDWESPALGGILGACHAVELGFVFGTYDKNGAENFFGQGMDADKLSAATVTAWLNFARNGDPSGGEVGDWPVYDSETRATMVFGSEIRLQNAPYESIRAVWELIESDGVGSL